MTQQQTCRETYLYRTPDDRCWETELIIGYTFRRVGTNNLYARFAATIMKPHTKSSRENLFPWNDVEGFVFQRKSIIFPQIVPHVNHALVSTLFQSPWKLHPSIALNIIFGVTYYLEAHNVVYIIIYLKYHSKLLIWYFGHYRTLTTSLGQQSHQ